MGEAERVEAGQKAYDFLMFWSTKKINWAPDNVSTEEDVAHHVDVPVRDLQDLKMGKFRNWKKMRDFLVYFHATEQDLSLSFPEEPPS